MQAAGIRAQDLDAVIDCTLRHPNLPMPTPVAAIQLSHELRSSALIATIPHHLGHCLSSFATSGHREAVSLVIDGGGSLGGDLGQGEAAACRSFHPDKSEHLSIYHCSDSGTTPLEKHLSFMPYVGNLPPIGMPAFANLGHMFSSVAYQVFGNYFDAGKVMALAPFGRPRFANQLVDFLPTGFSFSEVLPRSFDHDDRWPDRREEYQDLAASVQAALENVLAAVRAHLRSDISRHLPLCYSGGVALNAVANRRVLLAEETDLHVVPSAEDGGTALGPAYHGLTRLTPTVRSRAYDRDSFGRSYRTREVRAAASLPGISRIHTGRPLELAVRALDKGQILGWFSAGSEFGPRALGNRSILADPCRPDMQGVLNERVKHREGFRPFAPVILAEELTNWFAVDAESRAMRFMLDICPVRPEKYSVVPGVVHVDGTARVQTVTGLGNPGLYQLLRAFHAYTGVPILINTSLNVNGEPIVETPAEALWALLSTGIDACFIEGEYFSRSADFTSTLDLRPKLVAALERSPSHLVARCQMPYGEVRHELGRDWADLLPLCDGTRTAREVFAHRAAIPDPTAHRLLGLWHRYRLVDFCRAD